MLAGHYSASLAAKYLAPQVPLWVLCIAAQFIDIIWAVLVLLSIEHVRVVPALPSVPLDLYYMPFSHSLAGAAVWSILVLIVYRLCGNRAGNAAMIVAAVVLSHWFLDVVVHRPDLPLYDNAHKLGFALWNYPAAGIAVETGLLLAALMLLLRLPAFSGRTQRIAIVAGVIALCALTAAIAFGLLPVPAEVPHVVGGQLLLYALVAAGAWLLESRVGR